MADNDLEDLKAYAAQMQALYGQPTVVNPGVDRWDGGDALTQYGIQNGLIQPPAPPTPPTVVDPTVDHFQGLAPVAASAAEAGQQGQPTDPTDASAAEKGQAHLTFGGAIPALDDAPPPGVTPSVWNSLSDQGKADARRRLSGQGGSNSDAGAPSGAAAPIVTGARPSSVVGTGLESVPVLNFLDANRNQGATFDESGGGLRVKSDAVPFANRGAVGAVKSELGQPTSGVNVPDKQDGGAGPGGNPGTTIFNSGPTAVIPGGWKDATAPGVRPMLDEGMTDSLKALDDMDPHKQYARHVAALDAAKAAKDAALLKERAVLDGQLEAQTAKAHQLQQADAQAQFQAKVAEEEAKNATIDPDHFFATRDVPQKIALALGVAFGAFGSAIKGGPNQALEIINGAISNDIDAQKANLSNKRASADMAVKRAMQSGATRDQAVEMVRIQQLTVARNQAQREMLNADTMEKKAALQDVVDGLDEAKLKATGALKLQNASILQSSYHYQAPQVVGGGTGGATAGLAKDVVNVPDGKGGWKSYVVTNEKDRDQLVDESAKYVTGSQIFGQMQRYFDKGGLTWRTDPTSQDAVEALRLQVLGTMKKAQGESSDKDFDNLAKSAGDPKSWLSDGPRIMQQYIDNKRVAIDNRLKAANAVPAQSGLIRMPDGSLKPAARITGGPELGNATPSTFKKGL